MKTYYCPYCGEPQIKTNSGCIKCLSSIRPSESEFDTDYYKDKSFEQFGNYNHWRDILFEEIKNNPLFDVDKYNKRLEINGEKQNELFQNYSISQQNQPKCPTCGSTDVSKISAVSKVAGAATFGLFSKTAMSQFKCNHCGYKW